MQYISGRLIGGRRGRLEEGVMGGSEAAAVHARLLQALAAGDVETVRASFAEDAVWHFPGRAFVCGDHQGPDAIVKFLLGAVEYTEGTFRLEPIAIASTGDYVLSWQRITGTKGDRHLDETEVVVFEIRDGRVAEVWHRAEVEKIDAFFV
jgi:uncharacterized protein